MSAIKIKGLSLQQEKAANLLATGKQIADKKIAEEVGVKPATIADWKKDYKFKLRVMQLFESKMDLEMTTRAKRVTNILKEVYKQIGKRISEDSLETMPIKELIRMMYLLHAELRQDGNFNKKFLYAGIKDYGEGDLGNSRVIPDEDDEDELNAMEEMSKDYEDMRKLAGRGQGKVIPIKP